MRTLRDKQAVEDTELQLLLEGVNQQTGYDFRQYARPSLKRRIAHAIHRAGLTTISELQDQVLHDPRSLERLLEGISVSVTSMFRDPVFFRAIREEVVPLLRTYPFIRVWNAGCATGEEAYSIAILLEEEGLLDRCRIYATDMNKSVLKTAREGIFPLSAMKSYTNNYQQAGGRAAFSEYYTARYDSAIIRPSLRKNMVFSQHNLVTDSSFNQFHLILCRNVMIYFSGTLQSRVHGLLHDSLCTFGFLGMGQRESMLFTAEEDSYERVADDTKLFRKVA